MVMHETSNSPRPSPQTQPNQRPQQQAPQPVTRLGAPTTAKDKVDGAQLTIAPGTTYKCTASDAAMGEAAYDSIARDRGMLGKYLKWFNINADGEVSPIADGAEIYLPSAAEILFAQCYDKAGKYDAAEAQYKQLAGSGALKIMETARERASGDVGKSYGVMGLDGNHDGKTGAFLTQNPELAGASSKNATTVNGKTHYKVRWVNDWKCNIFMNDTVYSAGYKPGEWKQADGKKKYWNAGRTHSHATDAYREVKGAEIGPGCMFQKFGGSSSNESHNAILSSFIGVTDLGNGNERWEFSIIGAEQDRAAESVRSWTVKKGTHETSEGYTLRFFKPRQKR